jgi:hypothetical protein
VSGAGFRVKERELDFLSPAPDTHLLFVFLALDYNAHYLCFGHDFAVNLGFAAHALYARAYAKRRDFQYEGVAGRDGAAKARFLDAAKEGKLLRVVLYLAQDQQSAALGERFYDEDARHNGRARKMSLKERLVGSHLLDAYDSLFRHKLRDAVNQQEGIAVRQKLMYGANVQNRFHTR